MYCIIHNNSIVKIILLFTPKIQKIIVLKVKVLFILLIRISQGVLQLQTWVSANGVLKDCMITVYL